MACCAVTAYIVFRYLKLHKWLLSPLQTKQQADIGDEQEEPWDSTERPGIAIPKKYAQECLLNLGGLTCGSCVSELQNIIKDIPGVVDVSVSLSLLRARVAFTTVTSPQAIIDIIHAAGYDAYQPPTRESDVWAEVLPTVQESVSGRKGEAQTWRRAFSVSVMCSLTVAATRYLSTLLALRQNTSINLIICLAVTLSLVAGSKIHLETARSIWHHRKPNMSTLGSLGILLALIQAITVDVKTRQHWLYQPELDVIPILSTSVLGGRLLKAIVSERSLDFGTPLINLIPTTTLVFRGSDVECTEQVPTNMVYPGDRLLIREGDRLPCDGILDSSSKALVLETWINGSTVPRAVKGGDTVLAGSRVEQGRLVLNAVSCGRSTQLGKVLESVINAELTSSENPAENLTQHFATAVVVFTAIVCILSLFCISDLGLADVARRASTMLLAACPCTFSLSIPTTKLLATVRASKAGVRLTTNNIRIKDAAAAKTILFDKTGTLTRGALRVVKVINGGDWDATLWDAIRDLETGIHHPVASAVALEAAEQMANYASAVAGKVVVTEVLHELGRGVRGNVTVSALRQSHWTLAIGSPAYMESLGVHVNQVQIPTELRNAMATPVIIAVDGAQAGILVLQDTLRPDAISVVRSLKEMGIKVGMVTGDNYASAMATSRQVGIDVDMVFCGCLPKDKADIVKRFRRQGPTVFVGDNLNDIPSFQSASFSICAPDADVYSSGSLDPADATLMPTVLGQDSDAMLTRILFLIKLSRQTLQIINQNFCWAAVYNTISLLWASGAFGLVYPSSSSVFASIGMGFSSVVVLLNSSRIEKMPC